MRQLSHSSAPPWARLGVAVLLVALAGVAVCAGATDGPPAGQCRTFHDCGGREECFKGTCRCASALYSNRPPSCLQFSLVSGWARGRATACPWYYGAWSRINDPNLFTFLLNVVMPFLS